MARGLLNLCGVCTVPALLKIITIATDRSRPPVKRFTLTFVNGLAFGIQLCHLAASTMFSNPLNEEERHQLQREVLQDPDVLHTIERPVPKFENRYMWELPVALLFISITYWENFVEKDLLIWRLTVPFLQWKRRLNSVRERLYIFVGVWKAGWTLLFAAILLPGFTFNMEFSSVTQKGSTVATMAAVTSSPNVTSGAATIPASFLKSSSDTIVKRSISDKIDQNGISAVLNLTENNIKGRNHIKGLSNGTKPAGTILRSHSANLVTETGNKLSTSLDLAESVKENFQRYGPLYLQLLCSALLSYFGSLACKLCMQLVGFTVPLFMATPIALGIIIAQCYTKFIPSYLYIWLCPEISGDVRVFHLMWLGVLWVSHIILTSHIWIPRNGRMAKIDRSVAT